MVPLPHFLHWKSCSCHCEICGRPPETSDAYCWNSHHLFPSGDRNACVSPVQLWMTGLFPSCDGFLPVPNPAGLFRHAGSGIAGVPYVLAAEVLSNRSRY